MIFDHLSSCLKARINEIEFNILTDKFCAISFSKSKDYHTQSVIKDTRGDIIEYTIRT